MKNYSAIKEMFYGNRGGHDSIKIGKEELSILGVINEREELLLEKLSQKPEIIEIYKKLDCSIGELNSIENERFYIEGFRFGFLMAMDILDIWFFNKKIISASVTKFYWRT